MSVVTFGGCVRVYATVHELHQMSWHHRWHTAGIGQKYSPVLVQLNKGRSYPFVTNQNDEKYNGISHTLWLIV